MICDACKDGGTNNAEGWDVRAQMFHDACLHPSTCPCQHSTGISYNDYSKEDDR